MSDDWEYAPNVTQGPRHLQNVLAAGFHPERIIPLIPVGGTLFQGGQVTGYDGQPYWEKPTRLDPKNFGKVPGELLRGEWTLRTNWTNRPLTQAEMPSCDAAGASAGLLCGDLYGGLDLDALDPALAAAWHQRVCEHLPAALHRIGQAPKRMIPFKVSGEAIRKTSRRLRRGDDVAVLEIIGQGGQFVLSGLHPSTEQPYQWQYGAGLPATPTVDALPELTADQVHQIFDELIDIAKGMGWEPGRKTSAKGGEAVTSDLGKTDPAVIEAVMREIPNTSDYPLWVAIGLAIKTELGDDGWPFWKEWSDRWDGGRDNELMLQRKYDKFDPDGSLSFGTIRQLATDTGVTFTPATQALIDADLVKRQFDQMAAGMPEAPALPPGAVPVQPGMMSVPVLAPVTYVDPVLELRAMQPLHVNNRVEIDPRELQLTMQAVVQKYFAVNGKPTLATWQGEFYRWLGTHWEAAEVGWAEDVLSHVFNKVFCTVTEKKDEDGNVVRVHYPIGATIPFIKNHIAALQAITRRPRGAMSGWSDGRPGTWQAVQNGVLDMDTGRLCSHDPDFFNLTWVDAPWEPKAVLSGTRMEGFLADLLGVADQNTLLQEIFAYILSGDTSLQKAFMIVGQRRSGKGTLLRLLRALLGGLVASIKSNQLGDKFALEGTIGKSLLLVPDVRLSKDSDFTAIAEMILTVTGEDGVDIPRKNRTPWSGPTAIRMIMSSNSIPMLRDEDGVLASRFMYLTCPNTFYGKEDPQLLNDLLKERGAILKWAVDGWQRLLKARQFTASETHLRVVCEAETRMDPVGAFINQYLEVTGNIEDFLPTDELFGVFQMFCANVDIAGHSKEGFSKKLNAKQTSKISRSVRYSGTVRGYSGIKWRSQ